MNIAAEHGLRYVGLLEAANSSAKVSSLTHSFYRYPARFGECFVREAVLNFSKPGATVLDPFCGGGTTLVEALAAGRVALGSDMSELALFVANVKTTLLSSAQLEAVAAWIDNDIGPASSLLLQHEDSSNVLLKGAPAHYRRLLAALCDRLLSLPRGETRRFAACLILKTAQWALDGKEHLPTPTKFLDRLRTSLTEMRGGMESLASVCASAGVSKRELARNRRLTASPAASLSLASFGLKRPSVSLALTSPPYLGVHVLYNRWQLQGRRELKVPYYITRCMDAGHASKYTIIPRAAKSAEPYFVAIEKSFKAVSHCLAANGFVVQLVSFADAAAHLPRYLDALERAGLELCESYLHAVGDLSWRAVPGRRWYARVGAVEDSSAAQEVLLVHRKEK